MQSHENEKLKPCPFCGGKVHLNVADDQGTIRPEYYEENPRFGLTYVLSHPDTENSKCPVANYQGEILGTKMYLNRDSLIESWNKRI